jgi:mRNA-degrading endonuclease RelE of RelBE toxin-antitoxin system
MKKYKILPSDFFISQLENLNLKLVTLIYDKLKLLETNPKRNKKLFHKKYNLLRIRLSGINKEIRIVYTIKNIEVRILFILDRENDYKDLERYLKKVEDNL